MVELYERLSSAILISYISQIGLDPAEPYFQYLPEHVRLDPTDAKFVDAVHTDCKPSSRYINGSSKRSLLDPLFDCPLNFPIFVAGIGLVQPVGHLDFYPNGGREQPGCELIDVPLTAITSDVITAGRELFVCNHLRAIDFYIDSLLPDVEYMGYECSDYDAYLQV